MGVYNHSMPTEGHATGPICCTEHNGGQPVISAAALREAMSNVQPSGTTIPGSKPSPTNGKGR